ncbi:MAG: hypothetical protein KBA50_09495, partial [Sedimentibacter sp.]|nr:hypothetical protein [Sedimentibacter sp.]
YDSPNLFVIAHELGHGAFNLRHTFSPESFIAAERTTQNLMDYAGGTELWAHQWELIRDPQSVWFAWAQDESEGEASANKEYFITIDGVKALKIKIEDLKKEFNITRLLSNEELQNYPYKTIQVYILDSDKNDFKVSSLYVKNGENKGVTSEIVWGIKNEKEKDILFKARSVEKESLPMYFTSDASTYPVFNVEIIRVSPNIAYKQGGSVNRVIREDPRTFNIINEIGFSGEKVSLRPIFLTYSELNNKLLDFSTLFSRNEQCSYLVKNIKFGEKQYDSLLTLDWVEYSLIEDKTVYEIGIGEKVVKGVIKSVKDLPYITVIRSKENEETGYYVEDYYSTALGGSVTNPSLRDQNNSMKTDGFDVLGMAYKIPIIHYKNLRNVKLLLADIPRSESPSPLQYKINEQTIELGKEFTIQTPPNGTILDIKDTYGSIKGKVEFRQINESLLTPVLNIVTINTDEVGVSHSAVINDINAIYNTMNVSWKEGNHIMLKLEGALRLKNDIDLKLILDALRNHQNYRANQYYMIIWPNEDGFGGFAAPSLKDNWFITQKTYDKRIPAHELGHCSGLDEFVVNIGLIPASRRGESSDQRLQHMTTNIMGYSNQELSDANPLMDFYSWQITLVRQQISIRINTVQ